MPFMEDQQESPTFGGSLADDLFNDPQSALPGPDQISGSYIATAYKIDQLAVSGASQRIAWASNGMLAEITQDGRSVNLRILVRRGSQAKFDLSEPVKLDLPASRFQYPLTHVSWSPINGTSMLALVDSSGHFALYTASSTACRLNKTSLLTFEAPSSHAGCVALYWLRGKQPSPGPVKFAWKAANAWAYATATDRLLGPATVAPGMHAFLAITRDSKARMCFQQVNTSWHHTEEPLAPCDSLAHMLSHASVAPYKEKSLLVATLSLQSTLRTYEIQVDWGADIDQRGQPKAGSQLGPQLVVQCLKIVEGFGMEQHVSLSEIRTQPCHLLCMPPISEGQENTMYPASVIAIFSTIAQSHASSMTRTFSSRLVSHPIKESTEPLHSSFTSLAARRGKSPSTTRPVITLPREVDIDIPGVVVAATPQRADSMLVVLTNDGACRIFDRTSNALLECDLTSDKFRHPLQAAFAFTPEDKADFLDCAISPSGCAIAKCEKDGSTSIKQMDQVLQEPDIRTLAGLAMMSASSCFQHLNNEDALARSWQLAETHGPQELLLEFFKAIGANFEFVSEDSQQRMSPFLLNPIITKSLSILESLEIPVNGQRSIASKTASALLELRALGLTVQVVIAPTAEQSQQVDVTASLQGLVDWFNTLVCFLIDDVLDIKRRLRDAGEPQLSSIQAEATSMNSPALAILLGSCSRMLLRVACRFWRSIIGTNRFAASVPQAYRASWKRFVDSVQNAPVDLKRFEEFLVGINHYAQEAYDAANLSLAERQNIERTFLVTGVVPEQLDSLSRRLITTSVDRLVHEGEVDEMKLFRMDVRSLGLTDDEPTKQWWAGRRRCALRKIDIPRSVKNYRKCARCWRVTEEFTDPKTTPSWIIKVHRACLCGSAWVGVEG